MTLADALVKMRNDQDGAEAQKNAWAPDRTPLNGRRCRVLGRGPTEAECPPLKMQKLDSAAGEYLAKMGLPEEDFNSYATHRGDYDWPRWRKVPD